jgi:hypothetical protein
MATMEVHDEVSTEASPAFDALHLRPLLIAQEPVPTTHHSKRRPGKLEES